MAEGKVTNETVVLSEKQKTSQRARNIALAVLLIAFVVILYVGTWWKLGANILVREI